MCFSLWENGHVAWEHVESIDWVSLTVNAWKLPALLKVAITPIFYKMYFPVALTEYIYLLAPQYITLFHVLYNAASLCMTSLLMSSKTISKENQDTVLSQCKRAQNTLFWKSLYLTCNYPDTDSMPAVVSCVHFSA